MPCLPACTLLVMRVARVIFTVALVTGLAVFSLDCFAAATPDEAMQCCDSMPCPHHSGDASQDCCQDMPSMHGPLACPRAINIASHAPVALAMLPAVNASQGLGFAANTLLAEKSHAPPLPPMT